ncbi:MAG: hypothetical protein ACK4G3_05835 [bacterium]
MRKWWIGVLTLFLLGVQEKNLPTRLKMTTGIGDIFYTSEEAKQMAQYVSLVMNQLLWYWMWEGKVPKDMEELCQSPYFPIRCSDFRSIYTGKPVGEWKKEEPGTFWFEPEEPGQRLKVHFTLIVDGEPKTVSQTWFPYPNVELCWDLVKGWTREDIASATVAKTVSSFANFPSHFGLSGDKPRTFEELVGKVPLLKYLRNEFTGGYATASKVPSEGNFSYEYRPIPKRNPAGIHGANPNGYKFHQEAVKVKAWGTQKKVLYYDTTSRIDFPGYGSYQDPCDTPEILENLPW